MTETKSSTEQILTRMALTVDSVSQFCASFIKIGSINSGIDKTIEGNLYYVRKELENVEYMLANYKKPNEIPQLTKIEDEEQRQINVLIYLTNSLINEINEYKISIYNGAIADLKDMIKFCVTTIKNSYPYTVDLNGFLAAIKNRVNNDEKLPKYDLQIKSLISKTSKLQNKYHPKLYTDENLLEELRNASKNYISYLNYLAESNFDQYFTDYIEHHEDIHSQFEDIIYAFRNFEFHSWDEDLEDILAKLCQKINVPLKTEMYYSLYSCAIRYLFSKVSIQMPEILNNVFGMKEFLEICEHMKNQSPTEIFANKAFLRGFMPSHHNKPIIEICNENKLLREAQDVLSLMQFQYSPLEIAYLIYKARIPMDRYVRASKYINKKCNGDENAEIPESVYEETLEFDEKFSIFNICMAVAAPSNAVAIEELMKAFAKFDLNNELDYAATSIQACIIHLKPITNRHKGY